MLLILQLNSSIDLITGFHYYNLQVENPCITHRLNLCFLFNTFIKHFKSDPQPFFWTFWGMFLSHCTAVPQQKIESTVLQNTNQHISTAAAFIYIFFFSCFFGVQPPCVPQQISQAMFLRRNLRL